MQAVSESNKHTYIHHQDNHQVPLCNNTKLHKIERDILKHSGLSIPTEVDVSAVPIQFNGNTEYIHTSVCGFENTDILVFVHGFGGNGATFAYMLKDLSKRFKIYCIDLLGLGLSSKPVFNPESCQESIDFFVESIYSWTQSLGLSKFILAGHSLGGYISSQFTLKYQHMVKKLYLLSPPGTTEHTDTRHYMERIKELPFFKRQWAKMMYGMWEKKLTYSGIYKSYPNIFNVLVKWYVKKTLKMKGENAQLIKDYLKTMFKGDGGSFGSETCLYYMFEPTTRAYKPIEKALVDDIKVDTHVMFGDTDWMDSEGPMRIKKENRRKNCKVSIIEGSGHQLTIEQPKKLVEIILEENIKESK